MIDFNVGLEDSGIDSDPKTGNRAEDEVVFGGSDSSNSSSSINSSTGNTIQHHQPSALKATTKQLQRKLEARIEQAKRIQSKNNTQEYAKLASSSSSTTLRDNVDNEGTGNLSLIPIQRLPIPQKRKKQKQSSNTLIDFLHSNSESEDEMTLFSSRDDVSRHKQDLTDTFSIEELSEEDEGSEDSLHLGTTTSDVHPHTRTYVPDGCFSCQCRIL